MRARGGRKGPKVTAARGLLRRARASGRCGVTRRARQGSSRELRSKQLRQGPSLTKPSCAHNAFAVVFRKSLRDKEPVGRQVRAESEKRGKAATSGRCKNVGWLCRSRLRVLGMGDSQVRHISGLSNTSRTPRISFASRRDQGPGVPELWGEVGRPPVWPPGSVPLRQETVLPNRHAPQPLQSNDRGVCKMRKSPDRRLL